MSQSLGGLVGVVLMGMGSWDREWHKARLAAPAIAYRGGLVPRPKGHTMGPMTTVWGY